MEKFACRVEGKQKWNKVQLIKHCFELLTYSFFHYSAQNKLLSLIQPLISSETSAVVWTNVVWEVKRFL